LISAAGQLDLDFGDQRRHSIGVIHQATGIYTTPPEIIALLDQLDWPNQGERLLDPGAGNGGFLIAALARLDLAHDDVAEATRRVRGYEFYPGAVMEARHAVRDHLIARGWSPAAARAAAGVIVEDRDYLLSPVPVGEFDVIAANPPYWRLIHLPAEYRVEYELMVPPHARADLLFAYLHQSAEIIAAGGRIGLITADRWLLNSGAGELRRRLGARFRVAAVRRLDAKSAFYYPKRRRRDTPPRVHPVSLILTPDGDGRRLDAGPFRLEELPPVDGVPLAAIARIRLAPWLGPDGVFTVGAGSGLPAFVAGPGPGLPERCLVPVAEPEDITGDILRPARRWALVTSQQEPTPALLAHLDANLARVAVSARREPRWLPPETFAGRMPLDCDAVVVPRIAVRLKGVPLPAGRLAVNHQLVVISGRPVPAIIAMLNDPAVQAQADVLCRRVDGGYKDYTATLLRELIIPREHLTTAEYDNYHNKGGNGTKAGHGAGGDDGGDPPPEEVG
jgi:tRNA1(Val) A37 N6-methylase TrmN6